MKVGHEEFESTDLPSPWPPMTLEVARDDRGVPVLIFRNANVGTTTVPEVMTIGVRLTPSRRAILAQAIADGILILPVVPEV
jgi:hypothetical protein